jgi:hypothetical protein
MKIVVMESRVLVPPRLLALAGSKGIVVILTKDTSNPSKNGDHFSSFDDYILQTVIVRNTQRRGRGRGRGRGSCILI